MYKNLPPDVQAQVRCHHRAKNITSDDRTTHFELMPKRLSHQRVYFSNWEGVLPQAPYYYINSAVCLNSAQKRLGLSPKQLWRIDWENYRHFQNYVRKVAYIIVQKIQWGYNPSNDLLQVYDDTKISECELCGTQDSPSHFMRCKNLHKTIQGKKLFQILKAEISNLNISPIFWDILKQALTEETVRIPEGTPGEISFQVRFLLANQKEIGWENFVVGRLVKNWEQIAFKKKDPMTSGKCQHFPKIWKSVLKYIADLWRSRCYYVDRQRLEEEERSLDEQIASELKKDFSILPIQDKRLFDENNIPKNNSTTAHKKCWLFSVANAYEKQFYMLDNNHNTLFDHGFAIFDPI